MYKCLQLKFWLISPFHDKRLYLPTFFFLLSLFHFFISNDSFFPVSTHMTPNLPLYYSIGSPVAIFVPARCLLSQSTRLVFLCQSKSSVKWLIIFPKCLPLLHYSGQQIQDVHIQSVHREKKKYTIAFSHTSFFFWIVTGLDVFFDVGGASFTVRFLPRGKTINKQVYKEILWPLFRSVRKKKWKLWQDK